MSIELDNDGLPFKHGQMWHWTPQIGRWVKVVHVKPAGSFRVYSPLMSGARPWKNVSRGKMVHRMRNARGTALWRQWNAKAPNGNDDTEAREI